MHGLKTEEEIISQWNKDISKPKVSICCITYNQESYVEEMLRSMLMQETNFPYEILIHDDASLDQTKKIIQRYAKEYPKLIKPIYQEKNQYSQGKRVNFIFNFPRAKGTYIAICEGDDYWNKKYKLQKQVDILEASPEYYMCIHATGVLNVSNNVIENNKIRLNKEDKSYSAEDVILFGGQFGHTSSFLFRKEIIIDMPKWFLDSPTGDTALRLLSVAYGPIFYLDEEMSIYRQGVKESWTQKIKSDEQNFYNHWNCSIKMLNDYDEYTEYKYSKVIKKRISKIAYGILLNIKQIKKNEYKRFLAYLVFTDWIKFIIKKTLQK